MLEIIASPTGRPLPNDGCKCIRKPGAAFTSTTPPPCFSSERCTLSHTTSTPQISKPIMIAAATALAAKSGCTSSVTSVAVPPVLKLALLRNTTRAPLFGTLSTVKFCAAKLASAISSIRILVNEVACPEPRRGSEFTWSTNWRTLCTPSPMTNGGSRLAAATNLLPTTKKRKSLPGINRSINTSSLISAAAA